MTLPQILVLRDDCEFSREMRRRGFEVFNLPLITTQRLSDLSLFHRFLESINDFDAIFITSVTAAAVFADQIGERLTNDLPSIYVLGERSRDLFSGRNIATEYRTTANTADELLGELGEEQFKARKILFICGDRSIRTIPDRLGRVAAVAEAVVYQTVETSVDKDDEVFRRAQSAEFRWVCFFSPSAVDSYIKRKLPLDVGLKIATIGSTTADHVKSYGFSVDFVSERANAKDFAEGLARHIKNFE